MLISSFGLFALLLFSCGSEPAEVITFVQPDGLMVREGDTIESIARAEGVPIDELLGWNGLEPGAELTPGMKLLVFDFPPQEEVLASLAGFDEASTSDGEPVPASAKKPKPKPLPKTPPAAILRVEEATVVAAEPLPVEEIEEIDAVADAEEAEATGRRKITIDGSRIDQAGVLSGLEGVDMGSDDALANAAANMEKRSGTDQGSQLGNRGNLSGGGGEAESLDHVADTKVLGKEQTGIHGDLSGIRVPKMSKAAPKKCLKGPSEADLEGDEGYLMAQGLNRDQVRAGMSRVIRSSIACIPRGVTGEFTVTVEVYVGCDGLVDNVWLANSGGMPRPVTACIEHTVGYASFAAHALPDGAVFQYPITYRF